MRSHGHMTCQALHIKTHEEETQSVLHLKKKAGDFMLLHQLPPLHRTTRWSRLLETDASRVS